MEAQQTGIKLPMNYPELLFRQVDRIMLILSAPMVSMDMLRRSVDGMLCLVSFATTDKKNPLDIQVIDARDTPEQVYDKSLKTLSSIICYCELKGLLGIKWKRGMTLEGDDN